MVYKTKKRHIKSKYKNKRQTRNQNGGNESNDVDSNLFLSEKISCSGNNDSNYKEKGIIHHTESAGINALRDVGTGFLNFFGEKGFEGSVYEICKNKCLTAIKEKVNDNQKVCNLKIDIETNNKNTIFAHGYGSLFEKS